MKMPVISLFLVLVTSTLFGWDITEDIAAAVKTGNAKEISKYFNDNIDLKILNQEDVYSKAQAELILKDFFAKHPVKSFTVAHKSAPKNESQYVIIGSLQTTDHTYRTYFLIKKTGEKPVIQQFRIELENE